MKLLTPILKVRNNRTSKRGAFLMGCIVGGAIVFVLVMCL